jgi:hypothetical protein
MRKRPPRSVVAEREYLDARIDPKTISIQQSMWVDATS